MTNAEESGVGETPGGDGSRRLVRLTVALAAALYVAARLWRLDGSCLWFDELFGLHAARHGWSALLRFVALDLVHPPLFYLVLKVWVAAGGESAWWLRLLPVVASALAVAPLLLLGRELRLGARTVALALLMAAASGFLIKYAQEVRMYAPLLLFASCSLWLFARFCRAGDDDEMTPRRKRLDLIALTAANLLLIYTHYFGWLLVALELVYVAAWARARVRAFVASAVLLAACFAPWAWAVAVASAEAGGGLAQNIGWAARPRPREIFLPYLLLHEPFRFQRHSHEPAVLRLTVVMTLLIFAPALAALALRALKRARRGSDGVNDSRQATGRAARDENSALRFLVFFSLAPVVAAFLLAQLLPQSVWGTRHLVVVAPAYLLLAAHAVTTLRPPWLSVAARLLLACWLLLACAGALTRRNETPVWCSWETLAAQLARAEAGRGATVNVYALEDLAAYHLWHALLREEVDGGGKFNVSVVKNVPGVAEDRAFFLPRGFDDISISEADAAFRADDFWIAFRAARPEGDHALLHALAARGYTVGRRFEVSAQGQTAVAARLTRR